MPNVTLQLVKFSDADTGLALSGKPIQFQSSPPPSGSNKWVNEGAPVNTDGSGNATSVPFPQPPGVGYDFQAVFAGDATTLAVNIQLLNQTLKSKATGTLQLV